MGDVEKFDYTVLLVAQPNAGKTTLFNVLTGSRAYVGNWPGKTVEVSEGIIEHHRKKLRIVDLPGIQSFSTLSAEEALTKEVIMKNKWDAAIILVDVESLHKSLYFALQVLEISRTCIIAVSKYDSAEKKGLHFNFENLQNLLGVPIVPLSALKNIGIGPLLDKVMDVVEGRIKGLELNLNYGGIEKFIKELEKMLGSRGKAINGLLGDNDVLKDLSSEELKIIEETKKAIENEFGFNVNEIIAMERYRFINDVLKRSVLQVKTARNEFQDRLDSLLLKHWVVGASISILSLILLVFFAFIINTGFPLNFLFRAIGQNGLADTVETYSLGGLLSAGFDSLSNYTSMALNFFGFPEWSISLIVDGIIAGVGAVLSFLPLIFTVNIIMAMLEDSGIMARMAVIFNRVFQRFGLSGKSVFPMTISFACNVPAVLTSRIMETDKERFAVSLALPFIMCQARLIVLLFFIVAFFTSVIIQTAITVFVYFLSILLFLIVSKIFSSRIFKSEHHELLIELPSYHIPSLRVIGWISWERSKIFITKAGAVIFPFSIVLWLLVHLNFSGYVTDPASSFAHTVGNILSFFFAPMGLDKWYIGFSLFAGFFAKEVVIETFAVLFGTPYPALALSALHLSLAQSLALIVFVMLYTPCIATFYGMYWETKSLKLTLTGLIFELIIAYIISYAIFLLFTIF